MYKEDLVKAAFKVRGHEIGGDMQEFDLSDLLPHPKQGMPELPCNV